MIQRYEINQKINYTNSGDFNFFSILGTSNDGFAEIHFSLNKLAQTCK